MKGVIIIAYGQQELGFITKATTIATKDAVLDTNAARMANATFVIGSPDALSKLKELLEPAALAQQTEEHQGSSLSQAAVRWLASGERGASSNTLFSVLTGVSADNGHTAYPYDPSDLARCRLLLEACPELLPNLPMTRSVCPEWSALVDRWEELCAMMDQETPQWREKIGRAKQTYQTMKAIFESVEN